MMVIRFRTQEDYEYLLKKIKKMKKFAEELEDCLTDAIEDDDVDYRGARYRKEYDEDDMRYEGRYGYRRGGRRM